MFSLYSWWIVNFHGENKQDESILQFGKRCSKDNRKSLYYKIHKVEIKISNIKTQHGIQYNRTIILEAKMLN